MDLEGGFLGDRRLTELSAHFAFSFLVWFATKGLFKNYLQLRALAVLAVLACCFRMAWGGESPLRSLLALAVLLVGGNSAAPFSLTLLILPAAAAGRTPAPRRRIPGAALLIPIILLASVFYVSFRESSRIGVNDGFDWLASSVEQKCGAFFRPTWHGNDPVTGSFFPILLTISKKTYGAVPVSITFLFSALSAVSAFMVYLLAKRAYDKRTALFLVLLAVPIGIRYLAPPDSNELGVQSLISCLFVIFFLIWNERGGRMTVALMGLAAGIGFLNKIFFLTFLAAFAIAYLISRGFRRPSAGDAAVFAAFFLLGSLPFVAYNLLNGFPTPTFIGWRSAIKAGYGQTLPGDAVERIRTLESFLQLNGRELAVAAAAFLFFLTGSWRGGPDAPQRIRRMILLALFALFWLSAMSYDEVMEIHIHAMGFLLLLVIGYAIWLCQGSGATRALLPVLVVLLLLGTVISADAPREPTRTEIEFNEAGHIESVYLKEGAGKLELFEWDFGCPLTYFLPAGVKADIFREPQEYGAMLAKPGRILVAFPKKGSVVLGARGLDEMLLGLKSAAASSGRSVRKIRDPSDQSILFIVE